MLNISCSNWHNTITGNWYLTVLCCLDVVVELSYIFTFPMRVYSEYHSDINISYIWHTNIRYVYTVAQVSMTAASYVIVAAAAERYLVHCRGIVIERDPVGICQRTALLTTALVAAFLLKVSIYFKFFNDENKSYHLSCRVQCSLS